MEVVRAVSPDVASAAVVSSSEVVLPGIVVCESDVVVAGVVGFPVAVVTADVVTVVAGVVVVVTVPAVVVDGAVGSETETLPEVPDRPQALSVTSSTVVPGLTRVMLSVATPPVKGTLLVPAGQSPWAG